MKSSNIKNSLHPKRSQDVVSDVSHLFQEFPFVAENESSRCERSCFIIPYCDSQTQTFYIGLPAKICLCLKKWSWKILDIPLERFVVRVLTGRNSSSFHWRFKKEPRRGCFWYGWWCVSWASMAFISISTCWTEARCMILHAESGSESVRLFNTPCCRVESSPWYTRHNFIQKEGRYNDNLLNLKAIWHFQISEVA